GRRGKGRVREPRWWVGRRSGGRSLGRTPCRLVLPRRPAIRANDSQLAREVVHIAASPGHLKPLVANIAGVDIDFGVADVVELDAVFESVSDIQDDLLAVLLVVAGAQHHRRNVVVLAAGDHLMACHFVYVDGIEAIQVDESSVFRQHPHRLSPSLHCGGPAAVVYWRQSPIRGFCQPTLPIRAPAAVASAASSFTRTSAMTASPRALARAWSIIATTSFL